MINAPGRLPKTSALPALGIGYILAQSQLSSFRSISMGSYLGAIQEIKFHQTYGVGGRVPASSAVAFHVIFYELQAYSSSKMGAFLAKSRKMAVCQGAHIFGKCFTRSVIIRDFEHNRA